MENSKLRRVGEAVLLLALSEVMSNFGFSSLIAIAPLLFFDIRHGKRPAIALLAAGAILHAVLVVALNGFFDGTKLSFAILMINLYIPLSLSAAGIVWLCTKGRKIMGRLFMALAPAMLFLGCLAAFFYSDRALFMDLRSIYVDAFAAMVGPFIGSIFPELDLAYLVTLFLLAFVSLILPVVLCGICASCFIYETALHSRESGWEEKVMRMEYHPDAVWGFIISWALVLLCRFVSVPLLLVLAVMNAAGVWTVVYAAEGFSVLFARIRRRSPEMRSMTILVIVLVIALLVPGINFIVLIGLPLAGVLESFFDLKKIGGNEYENHS